MRLGTRFGLVALLLHTTVPAIASTTFAPIYTYPGPGSRYVLPQATILVRSTGPLRLALRDSQSLIVVAGSLSGQHPGQLVLSDDAHAVVFEPATPFTPGETVSVTIASGLETESGLALPSKSFEFEISKPGTMYHSNTPISLLAETPDPAAQRPASGWRGGIPAAVAAIDSFPSDFPVYTSSQTYRAAPGLIFMANLYIYPGNPSPYLMIVHNDGSPYFYRRMEGTCYDFKPQPNGLLTYFDNSWRSKFYAMDSTFTVVDSFQCGNGYNADIHELRVLPNGHALLLSYVPIVTDMRPLVAGGDSAALVAHLVIQELDTGKHVVFQWASWDHFQILDARGVDFTAHVVDYVHGNALDMDTDGNILLSSRHLDEISKIDHNSGDLIWRLGGNHNQFTFVNDSVGFSHQHAIRRIANGDLTLFDNGNLHVPSFSRAVEYQLDMNSMTATLVWQYRPTPDIYGYAMGYVERLSNGNTLVSWGATNPSITEVTPEGTVAYQLNLPTNIFNYRGIRAVWPPSAAASAPGATTLHTRLDPIAPNPVRGRATVSMVMGSSGPARLEVYAVSGRRIQTLLAGTVLSAGAHRFDVDGSKLAAGVYYCRLSAGGVKSVRKFVVLR